MICVTGGAGFIGSHLIKRLLKDEEQVCVIDNFNDFYDPRIKRQNIQSFIDKIKLYETDIRDRQSLEKIFSENSIDCVFHLAAMAGVRPSIHNPLLYSDVNVNGTVNLLECCKINSIKKFIFASSSSVYGNNKKVPFHEEDNVDFPISPYAATKKAGELICHNYHKLYDMNIFCLRFFSVYGPAQRPEMAISKFTHLILNEKPIPMYGNGSSSRDYTFIDDIINGVYHAYQKLNGFNIYNLGESKTVSLKELIDKIQGLLGKKASIQEHPMQPGDVERTFADISKAKKDLGYQPKTDIDQGLLVFIEYTKQNLIKTT